MQFMKRSFLAFLFFINCAHGIEVEPYDQAQMEKTLRYVSEKTIYVSAGGVMGALSLLAYTGSKFPSASIQQNEYLLLKDLCKSMTHHIFSQAFTPKTTTPPDFSWSVNHEFLSQIPTANYEEKKLLVFLENRWLAKSTGFFSSLVNWVTPCFGVSVQINPESTSHYARNPWIKISETYQKRAELWKKHLPQPIEYPLVLTRPSDLRDYLPSYISVAGNETVQATAEKLASKIQHSKVVLDVSSLFPTNLTTPHEWLKVWKRYQSKLVKACEAKQIPLNKILCVQKVQQDALGGLRILPFEHSSSQKIERDHRYLLKWISTFGLTANRLELDRCLFPSTYPLTKNTSPSLTYARLSKETFLSNLTTFLKEWKSTHPQKKLMVHGTLQVLEGLFAKLSDTRWNEIVKCPTRSHVVQMSFNKIQEELKLLLEEKEQALFFDTASHLEQVHASLSALLEVFSPYQGADFASIYKDRLTKIPQALRPLLSSGVHSSGMTSMAGIVKAVEKSLNHRLHVLYGENIYFECVHLAETIGHAVSVLDATENDWSEVDLILAQFNPALKRLDLKPTEYHVEPVGDVVRKALSKRENRPLTVAIDCTFDYINSSRIGQLLEMFQDEIINGSLNVVCFRSGLKFDLFGMDNYSGAPFYMIHNGGAQWSSFDRLLCDPVLQTDSLSLNWFCLAYEFAAPYLENYRKQIFDNTRALLDSVPKRLFDEHSNYRIVFCDPAADAGFIDVKISGPHHEMKGAGLVGGSLYLKCMEAGHPIFYRPSVGFYHPNFTMLFSEENTTIRLTVGLDPSQVPVLTRCFEIVDGLNGSPKRAFQKLLKKRQLQNSGAWKKR